MYELNIIPYALLIEIKQLSGYLIFNRYDISSIFGRTPCYAYRQFVPHYALFAQKCLRFKAFFRQGVFNSPDEHYRIRHVDIIYYLEDDTVCVIEPVVKNAGFRQGKLVKRDKIPKNTKGDLFIWKDFNVGIDICMLIYSMPLFPFIYIFSIPFSYTVF